MRLTAVLTTTLVLLLLAAGPVVAAESANEPPSEPILRLETGMHTAPITRLGVDRDGRWLLTASHDKTARLWDLANGQLLHTYRPPIGAGDEGKLYAGALSPDGRWVALAGWMGYAWDQSFSIYLFERGSGRLLRRLTGLPQVINHLAFSPDGRWLAAGLGGQNGIRLWRTDTWALVGEDREYKDQVYGLDWLQKQVTQHDVGMLFLAGHGLNTPEYTFLPANADLDRLKRTGVGMADIRDTLNQLAGKAVFFVDTCHSGNVLGKGKRGMVDMSAVVNELSSAENGVIVFSSSTGRQTSMERDDWQNGAFTKALLEGLSGQADQQKTGRITYKMLDFYISERVKTLTDGHQHPVTLSPQGVPDFPIAATR